VGVAVDWSTSLVEPETIDFWLETMGGLAVSPYDGSDAFTRRYSEWRCVLQWAVTTQAQAMAIEGFFSQARSRVVELNIPNFRVTASVGNHSGTLTVNGAHAAGATTLAVTGGSGQIGVGTIICMANQTHDRLHVVIAASGSPTSSLTIDPPLWWSRTGGEQVRYRGDGSTQTTDMRETMLLVSPLQGASLFPSPGSDTTGGYITSRAVELVSSKRAAA